MDYQQLQRHISAAVLQMNSDTKRLTDEQAARLHARFGDNLRTSGVKIGDDFIALSSGVFGNWQYYAGFEYIEQLDTTRIGDYTIYPDDEESGRVADVLAIINGNE